MSIELPEARILAEQLDTSLKDRVIEAYDLMDVERMMKIGFINKELCDFHSLIGRTMLSAVSRGNTIKVRMDGCMNLLISPEYGGVITLIDGGEPSRYHLKLDFKDGSTLTIRITSMGLIYAVRDENLEDSYMYRRDFLSGVSPDAPVFTWAWFKTTIGSENRQLKPLLVGKDAYIIGISNATFQDVIYRAGIHPKRKASELSEKELRALYDSIKLVIDERLRQRGKEEFIDIHGVKGGYISAMGSNMKDKNCPRCGSMIEKIAYGGGSVYLCPSCQR